MGFVTYSPPPAIHLSEFLGSWVLRKKERERVNIYVCGYVCVYECVYCWSCQKYLLWGILQVNYGGHIRPVQFLGHTRKQIKVMVIFFSELSWPTLLPWWLSDCHEIWCRMSILLCFLPETRIIMIVVKWLFSNSDIPSGIISLHLRKR